MSILIETVTYLSHSLRQAFFVCVHMLLFRHQEIVRVVTEIKKNVEKRKTFHLTDCIYFPVFNYVCISFFFLFLFLMIIYDANSHCCYLSSLCVRENLYSILVLIFLSFKFFRNESRVVVKLKLFFSVLNSFIFRIPTDCFSHLIKNNSVDWEKVWDWQLYWFSLRFFFTPELYRITYVFTL